MSFWKRQWKRPEPVNKSRNVTFTPGDATPAAFTENVIDPALLAASVRMQQSVKSELDEHRSEHTGTREQWSAKAEASNSGRMALADGLEIRIYTEKETGKVVADLGFNADVEYIARFLEYGYAEVRWGRETGKMQEPAGFMRRAFDTTKDASENQALRAAREGMKSL